jgi:hypothetical protein
MAFSINAGKSAILQGFSLTSASRLKPFPSPPLALAIHLPQTLAVKRGRLRRIVCYPMWRLRVRLPSAFGIHPIADASKVRARSPKCLSREAERRAIVPMLLIGTPASGVALGELRACPKRSTACLRQGGQMQWYSFPQPLFPACARTRGFSEVLLLPAPFLTYARKGSEAPHPATPCLHRVSSPSDCIGAPQKNCPHAPTDCIHRLSPPTMGFRDHSPSKTVKSVMMAARVWIDGLERDL